MHPRRTLPPDIDNEELQDGMSRVIVNFILYRNNFKYWDR